MDKDKAKNSDAGAVPGKDTSGEAIWRYEVPQGDAGAGSSQSNSAHYTGGAHGGDSQQGDFLVSPPEANAMPAGESQSSRGSAAGTHGGGAQGGAQQQDDQGMPEAGAGSVAGAGAGAGKTPGAPGGNGSKDEPIWGS